VATADLADRRLPRAPGISDLLLRAVDPAANTCSGIGPSVISEFRVLIDRDPVVRMCVRRPSLAGDGGDPAGHDPRLDMGTAAGFAAYRDPRINAMLKKIVAVWCEFLSGGDSLYGLNGSPSGGKSAEAELGRGQSCGPSDPHGKRKRRSRRLETALNKRHRGLKRRKPKNDLSPNAAASERRRPTRRGSRFTGRRGSVRPGRAGRR
jgi:hypothetical protein